MIEARCFGRSAIVTSAGTILPSSELLFAFALHLCVRAGEHVPRADLIEMFWPHADEVKGRHSLRQMLYRLKEMGFTLDEDGELLSLHPGRVRCDLAEALRAEWITEADEDAIAAACDALPGFTRRFSERYGEWIDEVRARLESQFRRAALRVLSEAKREGRWYDVEHWALMLLRTDPLNESAVLARAEGTAMLGSKAEAIEQLDRYLNELGPRAERIGLPAKVLRRRIKEQGERRSGQHALPLVGREEEMRVLTEGLHADDSQTPRGFYLFGPAGIGKSRILSECIGIAELSGMAVVTLDIRERELNTPHKLLIELSQQLMLLDGSIGSDPGALAILKRLSSRPSGASDQALPGSAVISARDIEWSTANVLSAILEERRLLVAIENCDIASPEDIALVLRILAAQPPHRLAFLFAGRAIPDALPRPHYIASSLLTPMRVAPLSVQDSTALARALLDGDEQAGNEAFIAKTVSMSAGNPLFIIELSRTSSDTDPFKALPRSLHTAIRRRLASLSPTQKELCRLICVLDAAATLAALRVLSGIPPALLARDLHHLESEEVVRAGAGGVVALHDCWLSVVNEEISPLTRRHLATSSAEYLSRHHATAHTPQTYATIARLYAEAQESSAAFQHYLAAGRLSYEQGLCSQALVLIAHAESFGPTSMEALTLISLKACAQHALGLFESATETAARGIALTLPRSSTSAGQQTTLMALLADASWKAGVPSTDALDRLATQVTIPGIEPSAREHSCFYGLRLAVNHRSDGKATHFWKWAGMKGGSGCLTPFGALTNLVYQAECGTTEDVLSASNYLQSFDLFSLPLHYSALCQRYIAQALRWAGDYEAAQSVGSLAFEEALRHGLFDEASMVSSLLAFAALDHSLLERAKLWHDKTTLYSREPRSHERRLSIRHAQARLLLQQSQWEDVYNLLQPEYEHILHDTTARRSVTDASCLAWAASHRGDTETVGRIFTFAGPFIAADAPSLQNDFPVTALFRALCNIGQNAEAEDFLQDYCIRRLNIHKRPVAPHYHEIGTRISHLSAGAN